MKKLVFAVTLILSAASALDAGTIRDRHYQQRERIQQGVRSGELTGREASRLRARSADVRRDFLRDRRDGGGVSPVERRRLQSRQDRLSRSIYRERHDTQYR